MDYRAGRTSGRDGTGNEQIEALLRNSERAGHRRPHWDLEGNDDAPIGRFDDPTESTKRNMTLACAGIFRSIDGEEH